MPCNAPGLATIQTHGHRATRCKGGAKRKTAARNCGLADSLCRQCTPEMPESAIYGLKTRFNLPTVADIFHVRIVSLYVTTAKTLTATKPLKTLIYMGV
jgi:hypothetical protein